MLCAMCFKVAGVSGCDQKEMKCSDLFIKENLQSLALVALFYCLLMLMRFAVVH